MTKWSWTSFFLIVANPMCGQSAFLKKSNTLIRAVNNSNYINKQQLSVVSMWENDLEFLFNFKQNLAASPNRTNRSSSVWRTGRSQGCDSCRGDRARGRQNFVSASWASSPLPHRPRQSHQPLRRPHHHYHLRGNFTIFTPADGGDWRGAEQHGKTERGRSARQSRRRDAKCD